jgi:hypothetical protein
MRVGIVGHEAAKFTKETEEKARRQMVQQVTWNVPKEVWTEMQKAREDARVVEGLEFGSMESFALSLLTLGLKIAQKDMERNRMIESPKIMTPEEVQRAWLAGR